MIQGIAHEIGDEEVRIPVIVVIGDRDAEPVSRVGESGLAGHVGEATVTVIPIEQIAWRTLIFESGKRPTLDEENIEESVAVVVEECGARAHLLGIEMLPGGAVDMAKHDP